MTWCGVCSRLLTRAWLRMVIDMFNRIIKGLSQSELDTLTDSQLETYNRRLECMRHGSVMA